MPQSLLSVLKTLSSFLGFSNSQFSEQDVAFLVIEVLHECSGLSGVATIWVVGTFTRDVTSFATFETEALRAGSVNVHSVGVALSRCSGYWGLVVILRARGASLKETSTRRHWGARVWTVGSWEVDARRRGGGFWMIGLLVDLRLLFSLSAIAPLTVKLDSFVLPDFEGCGDGVHRIDAFFDSFNESFLEHFSEGDVVVATESRVLLEVLNVLLGGVGGHGDVLEFGSSRGGGIGVAEASLKLMDEVEEGEEGRGRDVSGIGNLGISCELSIPIFRCFASFDRFNCLISPFCGVAFAQEREGNGDLLFVGEGFAIEIEIEFSEEGVASFDASIKVLGCFTGLL